MYVVEVFPGFVLDRMVSVFVALLNILYHCMVFSARLNILYKVSLYEVSLYVLSARYYARWCITGSKLHVLCTHIAHTLPHT